MKVKAIFDIGKTNKKFFLFDQEFNEVYKEYVTFNEIEDDDGYPCDDLAAIVSWIKSTLGKFMHSAKYELEAINFSTYGASLVHVDEEGTLLTPFYNYLKPYPNEVLEAFYQQYGDPWFMAQATSSPQLGMLNSGLQLYWLKQVKPEVFRRIRYSLHFPQYLSYVLTGRAYSEYTSIGCHTMLWDFTKSDYHSWVYAEGVDRVLAPLEVSDNYVDYPGTGITVGVGLHDSSAALLPYLRVNNDPFLLLSTGTWSIVINPFNYQPLSRDHLQQDCLNFLRTDGKPVRAARLFLGNEYTRQVEKLISHFGLSSSVHKNVAFNEELYHSLIDHYTRKFHFESIRREGENPSETRLDNFSNFEEAYHQLMIELVELQVNSIKLAVGDTVVRKLYIDGGFADNKIFIELLARELKGVDLLTTHTPLGSALGAVLMISKLVSDQHHLKKHFKDTKTLNSL
uniref:FGGY family carbohydrate kinase n=1 Tax=Roseihalotalea indica TaxID=2867963 RepID=A0AA49JEY1_9BACT|nr:FGGY family carbohydrate kinase [Tunicatimonas sp. TK19036]